MFMKQLLLHDTHLALGASFIDSGDLLLPNDYGDPLKEYEAVKKGAGVTDLSHRGKLRLSGKEYLKFLQGMLTNDVIELQAGRGMYAAILTVKGKMVSDMRVYRSEDGENDWVLLDLEPGLDVKVGGLLKKFRLSYKADIDDVTENLGLFSVSGPRAHELLNKILGKPLSDMEEYQHTAAQYGGTEITVVKVRRTTEEGYDLYVPADASKALWETLIRDGEQFGLAPVGSEALNILRIEAGIPIYGVDMDEDTIPIEAGIWSALSFEKGCYVGQEVIARIKWRGHVNRHLVGFDIQDARVPRAGDELVSGERKVGRVTSSAFSPGLHRPLALGYIRRGYEEPGTKISIKSGENLIQEALVSGLPF